MAVLPIYVAPHPVLKKVAEKVEGDVTDDLRRLMDDMLETMYSAHGIGLAAPQIGVSKRVIVMDLTPRDEEKQDKPGRSATPLYFINPEIMWTSDTLNLYNEGCLSVPDQYAEIERPERVRVQYLDYHGKAQEIEADGLLATCLQHEIDHLNGVLFVDHLSTLKRDILLRKVKKWAKDNADAIDSTHVL